MIISIDNLGQVGLIKDMQPHTLPPNAFSSANNVRFTNGEIERVRGYASLAQVSGQVMAILPYDYATSAYWLIRTAKRWYSYDGTTVTDIAGESLSGNTLDQFNECVYNGIAISNNGTGAPRMWTPDLGLATALTNWPSDWKAKVIRPYRNFLIALNMTEAGVEYPTRYRWSSLADPGTVPTSWIASATNQAGDDVIEETQGAIVDAVPLRQDLVIYKTDSTYLLSFVGGQFVMQNRPHLKRKGMHSQRCGIEYESGKHFVVDRSDIYVHDGQTVDTILKGRMYNEIFGNIDEDSYFRSYVARNPDKFEVWFCYPESGEYWPTKAAIWNWKDNTWSTRDIPNSADITEGVHPSTEAEYNPNKRTIAASREDATALYPSASLYPDDAPPLYPDPGESTLMAMEEGWTAAGSDITCSFERTGLKPEKGDGVWLVRAAFPHAEGGDLTFYVGSHDSPNSSVTWEGPYTYAPEGSQEKIDCRVTGRYLAFKGTFPAAAQGALASIDFDVVKVGTR